MDNYAQLKDAVLGATQQGSPGSPLGNFPELAKLYESSFQLPLSNAATQVQAANTGVTVANQKAAEEAAIRAESQRIQDESDPKKYQVVRKEDGGFDFFDPSGNQIDIATYTQKTGQRTIDVIKDSENPIDIQYVNDYQNLQDYVGALQNGDREKLDAIRQASPELSKYDGKGGVDKLIKDFKNYYQRYYVTRQQNPQAWGTRPNQNLFVPNAQVAANNSLYGTDAGIGG